MVINKNLFGLVIDEKIEKITDESVLQGSFGGIETISIEIKDCKILKVMAKDSIIRLLKKWCWSHGYQIRSSYKSLIFDNRAFCDVITSVPGEDDEDDSYVLETNTDGDTELDAVIAAAEWIAMKLGLMERWDEKELGIQEYHEEKS